MCRKTRQRAKFRKLSSLFRSEGCLRLFIALARALRQQPLEGRRPQKAQNGVDLNTLGKIFSSCFWKGMDLGNPMIGSKVVALKN